MYKSNSVLHSFHSQRGRECFKELHCEVTVDIFLDIMEKKSTISLCLAPRGDFW